MLSLSIETGGNQSGLECCCTIAQQLLQSFMTARELSIVVVKQPEKIWKAVRPVTH